jgi:ABC-2 type transport system permease protein
MRKFLAVVKREYLKLVWSKTFIIGTLAAPLLSTIFAVVPALMFSIEGEATRIAVIDQSGKLSTVFAAQLNEDKQVEKAVRNSAGGMSQSQVEQARQTAEKTNVKFIVEIIKPDNRALDEVKQELNSRLREQKLDSYVIIPANLEEEKYDYFARNTSDFVAQNRVERALNQALRQTRLAEANISLSKLDEINKPVKLSSTRISETGENSDSGESFLFLFVVGIMIYITLLIYGQTVLAAVVEEKETRIAEILFSSASPFELMLGKLVGVGLVAMTQLGIWVLSGAAILGYGLTAMNARGFELTAPYLSPAFVVLLFVYFLLGFFTYATIYALIGSMVTTVQEGGQLSFPIIMILVATLYAAVPVIRSPNSTFSFWLSILPFVSPIVMPIRLAINTPPLWQIALSIVMSLATIIALVWLAGRTYRIGMLMYGKKATIPEVFRWIRQP